MLTSMFRRETFRSIMTRVRHMDRIRGPATFHFSRAFHVVQTKTFFRYLFHSEKEVIQIAFQRYCAISQHKLRSGISVTCISCFLMLTFFLFLLCCVEMSAYPTNTWKSLFSGISQSIKPTKEQSSAWNSVVVGDGAQLKFHDHLNRLRRAAHINWNQIRREAHTRDMKLLKSLLIYCPLKHRNMISKTFFQNGAFCGWGLAFYGLIRSATIKAKHDRNCKTRSLVHSKRASTDKYFPKCFKRLVYCSLLLLLVCRFFSALLLLDDWYKFNSTPQTNGNTEKRRVKWNENCFDREIGEELCTSPFRCTLCPNSINDLDQ